MGLCKSKLKFAIYFKSVIIVLLFTCSCIFGIKSHSKHCFHVLIRHIGNDTFRPTPISLVTLPILSAAPQNSTIEKGVLAKVSSCAIYILGSMLPIQVFESLCEKHPSLTKATIKQMSNRCYRLIRHMSNQAFGNSLDKIEFSLELSKRHLGNFYLTHEQIAILSGLNRVTVTKAMPKNSR